ncbi:GNAT family N-acetyltransferase [Streptomyces sp. ICBB 8177]|uniref:GNAT family N-acetyltransferase n=1 Tax=Streptomyces sp. ICBB 8177 TaxID=563922 RepID=UPI001F540840|nr:GNAT family N-acetyltransferase [Streptomyces sp. ICBB 8177]
MLRPVEIEAYGLLLRPWEEDDAPEALRGLTDPDYLRWNPPAARPVEDIEGAIDFVRTRALGWRRGETASFAVLEDGVIRGHIGLNSIDPRTCGGRVGYWTLPEARGRRLASRALEACTRWAFRDLGLHRLELGHAVGNGPSCGVARRCGYAYEGTLRDALPDAGGGFHAVHLHARLATDPAPDVTDAPTANSTDA